MLTSHCLTKVHAVLLFDDGMHLQLTPLINFPFALNKYSRLLPSRSLPFPSLGWTICVNIWTICTCPSSLWPFGQITRIGPASLSVCLSAGGEVDDDGVKLPGNSWTPVCQLSDEKKAVYLSPPPTTRRHQELFGIKMSKQFYFNWKSAPSPNSILPDSCLHAPPPSDTTASRPVKQTGRWWRNRVPVLISSSKYESRSCFIQQNRILKIR